MPQLAEGPRRLDAGLVSTPQSTAEFQVVASPEGNATQVSMSKVPNTAAW